MTPAPIDLRPPRAAAIGQQQYLVDAFEGELAWVTGTELISIPPPVKVLAIAWRL